MKIGRKRVLSFLLAILMLVATLPIQVFAGDLPENVDTMNLVKVIVENTTFPVSEGAVWDGRKVDEWIPIEPEKTTMMQAVVSALEKNNISVVGAENGYISSIGGLEAGKPKYIYGWMGTLNDWFVNAGFNEFNVEGGDIIHIAFSKEGGKDLGGAWDNNIKTLKDIEFNTGTLSPTFAEGIKEYTLTVPTGTNKIKVTPTATNKNFLVKTTLGNTQEEGGKVFKHPQMIPVQSGDKVYVEVGNADWPSMNNPPYGEAHEVPSEIYIFTIAEATTTPTIDKNKLELALANVQDLAMADTTSADGKDVATDKTWVRPEVAKALADARVKAQEVKDKADVEQEEVDAATKALEDALVAYKPQKGTYIPPKDIVELDALSYNGNSISLEEEKTDYSIELPEGTTTVPTVEAKPRYPETKVEITQAQALPGTAKVLLTSRDNSQSKTYNLSFTIKERTWQGAGSQADPYLLQDGSDMNLLQKRVNGDKEKFKDTYFKITADQTLPSDWIPLGTNSKTNYFAGNIDGGNHTITIPKGSKTLLGAVSYASIKDLNIYGEEIAGYGLVEGYSVGDYNVPAIDIDNVTLKSGSKTLKAGFIGGYASGTNVVNISNSTIEKEVIIGYDKSQEKIGSFAGDFNGTIRNCKSAATVYGTKYVGGIVGSKGQSMGPFVVENSVFTGTIEATGDFVGGVVGAGYDGGPWGGAVNTPAVSIINSYASANISGNNRVGGIFGGEPVVEETWDNGIGKIQKNIFIGSLKATGGDQLGGIIGYMNSLNKNNQISYNYSLNQEVEKGIGASKIVQTNNPSPTPIPGVEYKDKVKYNRTDDPLGKDAESLAKILKFADTTSHDGKDVDPKQTWVTSEAKAKVEEAKKQFEEATTESIIDKMDSLRQAILSYKPQAGTKSESVSIKVEVLPSDIINPTIVVTEKGLTEEISSDPDGSYKLSAGNYTVRVTAHGYKEKTQEFTVGDQDQTITVMVEKVVEKYEGPFTFIKNTQGTEVTITGYNTKDVPTDLVIPDEIEGLPVTKIANEAFKYSTSYGGKINTPLTSLSLPKTLKEIGTFAFQSSNLKTITLPSSLELLGSRAFALNPNLTNAIFEDGIKIKKIPDAFYGTGLESITIPEGVEVIGESSLHDTKLKSISLPSSLKEIETNAFSLAQMEELTLPSTIQKLNTKYTSTGKESQGSNGLFFRNFEDKASKLLRITKVYDQTGVATPINTRAIVNPVAITIKYVDKATQAPIKDPQIVVGKELKKIVMVPGKYFDVAEIAEGDGHYYTDYRTPSEENAFYTKFFDQVADNYYSQGKEYTFIPDEIPGYKAPENVVKNFNEKTGEIIFEYEKSGQISLTLIGEGLSSNPEAGQLGKGQEVTVTVQPPVNKSVAEFRVNGVDKKADLKGSEVEYTYKNKLTEDTKIEVTYEDFFYDQELKLEIIEGNKVPNKIGDEVKVRALYRGKELDLTKEGISWTASPIDGIKINKSTGEVNLIKAGQLELTASLDKRKDVQSSVSFDVEPVFIKLRIEAGRQTLLEPTEVKVSDLNIKKDYNYTTDIDFDKAYVIHAVFEGAKLMGLDTKNSDVFDAGSKASYVSRIGNYVGGDSSSGDNAYSGWMYYVNNAYPLQDPNNPKMGAMINEYELKDGDYVNLWYTETYMYNSYVYFAPEEYTVEVGKELELNLDSTPPAPTGSQPTSLDDIVILHDRTKLLDESGSEYKTDAEGKVKVKFANPGVYHLSAQKLQDNEVPMFSGNTITQMIISRPYAKVTVTEATNPVIDKTKLDQALTKVQDLTMADTTSADGKDVAKDQTWVTPEVAKALADARVKAQEVKDKADVGQKEVDAATQTLEDAIAAYKPQAGLAETELVVENMEDAYYSDNGETEKTIQFKAYTKGGIPANSKFVVTLSGEELTGDGQGNYSATIKSGQLNIFDISLVDENGAVLANSEGEDLTLRKITNLKTIKLIDFKPAPGQFVNTSWTDWKDPNKIKENNTGSGLTLGGYGGYLVVDMLRPVKNDPSNPYGVDFTVFGNSFAINNTNPQAYNQEPASVFVMKDENGNGLADDTWYELAGSEHGKETTTRGYTVTYTNPKGAGKNIPWTDSKGNKGYVYANNSHTQEYYPMAENFPNVNSEKESYTGTLILEGISAGDITINGKNQLRFGYAETKMTQGTSKLDIPDNPYTPNSLEGAGGSAFDISWAIDDDGNPVKLDEVRFIKVVSATCSNQAGGTGEISPEITGITRTSPIVENIDQLEIESEIPRNTLEIGSTGYLIPKGLQGGREGRHGDLVWSSSNEDIATIDPITGKMKGLKEGKTTVTLSSKKNSTIKKEIEITVASPIEILLNYGFKYPEDKSNFTGQGIIFIEPLIKNQFEEEIELKTGDLDWESLTPKILSAKKSSFSINGWINAKGEETGVGRIRYTYQDKSVEVPILVYPEDSVITSSYNNSPRPTDLDKALALDYNKVILSSRVQKSTINEKILLDESALDKLKASNKDLEIQGKFFEIFFTKEEMSELTQKSLTFQAHEVERSLEEKAKGQLGSLESKLMLYDFQSSSKLLGKAGLKLIEGQFNVEETSEYNVAYFDQNQNKWFKIPSTLDKDKMTLNFNYEEDGIYTVVKGELEERKPVIDKTKLDQALIKVQDLTMADYTSADGKDVAKDQTWVTPEVAKALADARVKAQEVKDKADVGQKEVDAATKTLEDAIATYKPQTGKKAEIPVDTTLEIIEGKNQIIDKENLRELTVKSSGSFENFVSVKVNGQILASANYIVEEGSIKVTLKESYIDSLEAGVYTLEIESKEGIAKTSFTIRENNPPTPQPEKAKLRNAIVEADKVERVAVSDNGKDISPRKLWTTKDVLNNLDDRLVEAKAIYHDKNASQGQVDQVTQKLNQAIKAYQYAKKHGTKESSSRPSYPTPSFPQLEPEKPIDGKNSQPQIPDNKNDRKFIDIIGHWAEKVIEYVTDKGYFRGTSQTTFSPDTGITRAQFVTVLGRREKVEPMNYQITKMKDIEKGSFYEGYVNWAIEKGLVKGVGQNSFSPNRAISREEMATILERYLDYKGVSFLEGQEIIYVDQEEIAVWAKDSVKEMSRQEIVKGREGNRFAPKDTFTRAEMAQILFNMETK